MGLISEYVEVKLSTNTYKYYEKMGYELPKKDNGKINWDEKIKVKVDDLQKGSCVEVLVECDTCGIQKQLQYHSYLKYRLFKDKGYYCNKCFSRAYSGEKNALWKKDKTKEERIRDRFDTEYVDLVKNVLTRDNYTCICCGKTNTSLAVHHLDGYHWCAEKRKDINNCVTLCAECHTIFHSYYGKRNNTREQFEEWLGKSLKIINSGNKLVPYTRKVYCLENNTIYECARDCQRHLHIKRMTQVAYCCSNHPILNKTPKSPSYQTHGYHLFWLDEYEQMTQDDIKKFLDQAKQRGTRRKIVCVNTGKAYDEINHAKRDYNNINCSEITACCRGKQKSAGKLPDGTPLQWMYYEEYLEKIENGEEVFISQYENKRKIICITTNKIFDSQLEAHRFYKIDSSGISKACRGEQTYCGRLSDGTPLQWMYYSDFLEKMQHNEEIIKPLSKNITQSTMKEIICVTTGRTFSSIREADRICNVDRTSIGRTCKGLKESAGKLPDGTPLKWMYYSDFLNLPQNKQEEILNRNKDSSIIDRSFIM